MPNHTSLASLFGDIANAIRGKTGGSGQIAAEDFPTSISEIATGLTFVPLVTAERTGNLVVRAAGLEAEPKLFVLFASGTNLQITSNNAYRTAFVLFDGTNIIGATMQWVRDGGAYWELFTTYTKAWDATTNTLTINAPSGKQFQATGTNLKYMLLYAY